MAQRTWTFYAGVGVLSAPAAGTDFWLEPRGGNGILASYSLRDCWEAISGTGLAARQACEARLLVLHSFVGRSGAFQIDTGNGARSWQGVRLAGVSNVTISNNALLEYSLDFEFPFAGQLGAWIQFGEDADSDKVVVYSDGLVRTYDKEQRNSFKYPWRANPVLLLNGQGLRILRLMNIHQQFTDDNLREIRATIEAQVRNWQWLQKGRSRKLKIDNSFLENGAKFYLRNVTIRDANLPDALGYELEFVTGYGE